ncbi:nucleoporin NDC1 [Lampris incognitus]|uniref:nucleoporin NDC1 n=1 Tax=Lampris incognitus TaxID=2546036 RepID=UPI0024B5F553|nr:nucleoporin NDC1 [Lampris incognitus]
MSSAEQCFWFVRKVICWRAAASIAWSALLLPPTAAVFVVLGRFSLFHPSQWLSDCLSFLTSPSAILSFIPLCGVIVLVGFLNLKHYTVIPSIACSKFALLGQLLHPHQFVHSLVHCLMGLIVTWCCAIIIGGRYQTLSYSCTQGNSGPQMCLNEYHLILLLAGAFIGCSHSLLGVVHNMNYVSFHAVQQYKYLHFKGTLPFVLKCSATQALYSIRSYLVVYFFLGYIPKAWLCKTLNLQLNSSLHPLDTIAGLLDLSLLYHLWISGTFLLLTWYITLQLFRIFVTEVYSFPMQSSFTEDAHLCLPKVLACKQPMIMKFLALQDLALLSEHCPSRRGEVFSLSQPGGHPYNWNAISQECLSLLADLTQRLVVHHDTVTANAGANVLSAGSDKKSSSSDSSAEKHVTPRLGIKTPGSVFIRSPMGGLQSPMTAPFTPDLGSPFSSPAIWRLTAAPEPFSPWYGTVQSPQVVRRGHKLWSASTDSQTNGSLPPSPAAMPSPVPAASKPSLLAQFLQNRKEWVRNFLAKRVLIMYLFNKLPEASNHALFADSQSHIWALEGLSHLVKASFSEDRYGIVQTTLPSILSTLLVLQEAVDRHFKLPHASSKLVKPTYSMGDSTYKTLRFALRATLKTAIYRITTTFGEHLNAVQMSAEHQKRLKRFLKYED